MKIIVDAQGGDHAPREIVRGCLEAQRELGVQILLVGRGEAILQALNDDGHTDLPAGFEVSHAPQVVEMDDNPASTLRDKPESSMAAGLRLLADGAGQAFVCAGNTGALLSAGTFLVKRIKGIRRAALAPLIPTAQGSAVLLDSGATVDCLPEYLLQFAYMGAYYMRDVRGLDNPRVGLLNIGTEESKGTALYREAYALLRAAGDAGRLNFVGNLEARELPLGGADVVVADGFAGNVLLKGIEGTAMFLASQIKQMFLQNAVSKLAGAMVRPGLERFKRVMDYAEVGGAVLLGLNKPVIKAHGSSKAKAVLGAVRQAAAFAESDMIAGIAKNIELMKVAETVP